MMKFRIAIIALLLHLTIFFNIERLDLGQENVLNIQTFVYIISFIAAFSVIIIPNLWKPNVIFSYVLWVGIYLVIKFVFNPSGRAVFGEVGTYIIITEITMIILTILLSRNLATHLHDSEETIKSIMMAGYSQHVRKLEESNDDIQLEFYRSRRNQYPLSVIVIDVDHSSTDVVLNQTIEEIMRATRKHYISMSLARVIHKTLRRTDMLLHQADKGRFILLSPETNMEDAINVAKRIRDIAQNDLSINARLGLATFPEDALTFDELLDRAEKDLAENEQLANSIK